MAYSYSVNSGLLNNLGEIFVPVVQCGNIICNDKCDIGGNVSWNDCDANIAHIGNAYISNLEVNNIIANIPQAFGDHLVFYDTTTKQLSHNTGYYTQTLNVTWTSSLYGFQVTGKIIYNIVGNAVFYQLIFNPYIYYQSVTGAGYFELPAGSFPVPPSNGNIYPIYIYNGVTYGQQPCLLRVFDNGGASIENLAGTWATINGETLSIYNYAFVIVNQV